MQELLQTSQADRKLAFDFATLDLFKKSPALPAGLVVCVLKTKNTLLWANSSIAR